MNFKCHTALADIYPLLKRKMSVGIKQREKSRKSVYGEHQKGWSSRESLSAHQRMIIIHWKNVFESKAEHFIKNHKFKIDPHERLYPTL